MSAPTVSAARTARLVGTLVPGRPAYRALADALRLAVADGRIPAGTRLPSERELTAALDVSRTTVTRAYAVLRDSGYLTSRRGSGSVATLPSGSRQRSVGSLFPADAGEGVIDLTCAATRAPAGVVEAYERAVGQLPRYLTGAGYLTLGVPELREVIADRYTERGLPTSADQVLVTSGAVAGIGIVLRALVGHGDRVVVENPGYPNTIDAARRGRRPAGAARPRPRRLGRRGVRPHGAVRGRHGRPADPRLPQPDRRADGRRRPGGARPRPAAGPHRAGHRRDDRRGRPRRRPDAAALRRARPARDHRRQLVEVALGRPAHRLGPGPRTALAGLVESRVTSDLGAPVLEQLVLLELMRIAPGLTPERRDDLRASRDALVAALGARLPELRFRVPRGGLFLWCELPEGVDASGVAVAAEDEGLLVAAGPRFAVVGGLERWVRLPYVLAPEVMTDAVDRLARAVETVRPTGSGTSIADARPGQRRPVARSSPDPDGRPRERG